MKKNIVVLALLALILNACSVGTKSDLMSGLKISNNGLSYADGYLSMDKEKLNSNEFPTGKTVYLYLGGVDGFTVVEDKVYLGASIIITDETGNKVADVADLFEQETETGRAADQAKEISLNVTVGEMFEVGKKYVWKSKIWDKKGKGVIEAESTFIVK